MTSTQSNSSIQEYQNISRKVAKAFDLTGYYTDDVLGGLTKTKPQKWLYDDWHTIMELCIKHSIYAVHGVMGRSGSTAVIAYRKSSSVGIPTIAFYADHNQDARLLSLSEVPVFKGVYNEKSISISIDDISANPSSHAIIHRFKR